MGGLVGGLEDGTMDGRIDDGRIDGLGWMKRFFLHKFDN